MAGKSRYQSRERRQTQVYRGAYEGLQEELYLKHLKKLIHQCESRNYDVDFRLYPCGGGNPLIVTERASNVILYNTDQQKKTAIFDHDRKEVQFRQALDKCKEKDVFPAYAYFTDKSNKYYQNPDLSINKFIEKVLNDTGCNSCA